LEAMESVATDDAAIEAAVYVGMANGWSSADWKVLQRSNNVVVWLRPHPIVAKVGVFEHSERVLTSEVEVAALLATAGAPVGSPAAPSVSTAPTSGLPVSLWERLVPTDGSAAPQEVALTLKAVHNSLREVRGRVSLPSYEVWLDRARQTLYQDEEMHLLPTSDLVFLREEFDRHRSAFEAAANGSHVLHGEPHSGNFVVTADGPRLIDFEGVCIGPIEWDLASVPVMVAEHFPEANPSVVNVARRLNSARVATWCWARAADSVMRAHGEHHLALLRSWADR